MKEKENGKTETILLRISKEQKEKIFNIVAKSSYNSASELIRAGIDKELNLQMHRDNLEEILQEISKCIDYKLDGFIKSQRKLTANNTRISAMNTYILGEVMSQIFGDEFHEKFIKILQSARKKANYYVSRKVEDFSTEDLYDFYNIGNIYRNE